MTGKLIAGNRKVEFGSFVLEELFTASKGDTDLQKRDINGKGQFVVTSGETNQGIEGRTDRPAKIFPANTITIDFLGNVYYREYEYKMVTHNRVCSLSGNVIRNDKVGIYLVGVLSKLRTLFSYNHAATWDRLKVLTIELPVTSTNDIDYEYMEERIAELEQERIAELDAYLVASGLDDYELTDEDKEILSLSPESASEEAGASEADHGNGQIRFKKFALGGVFNIYSPKKRFNANTVQFGGKYPYVARGSSNNGIRGYITEDEQYLSPAKSLSFGQDTATVFYQPDAYFTGDKIKVMVLNNHELNDELAQYFITVITKSFSTFAWGQSSFNEKILKATEIVLPVIESPDSDHEYTVDDIDFDYMERYIHAIEKLVIADVVKHKDEIIDTTKQLVTE